MYPISKLNAGLEGTTMQFSWYIDYNCNNTIYIYNFIELVVILNVTVQPSAEWF
jgi:hypothetical protein